jgi:hypothetical protein
VRTLLVLAVAVAIAAVASRASATTMPSLIVPVKVALKPHSLTLSQTRVRRGYYVEFHVHNRTAVRRRFTVVGRTITIPARKLRLLAIEFDVRGVYRIVSRGGGSTIRTTFRVS